MKRFSFITLSLLAVALTASVQAQSYYAEEYIKSSGKLSSKMWVSDANGVLKMRSVGYEPGFGLKTLDEPSLSIIRLDSAKMFMLDTKAKTYTYWDLSAVMKEGTISSFMTSNLGRDIAKDRNQVKEFIGMENIEGYECKHYRYKTATTLANGKTENHVRDGWFYEPLKIEIQWAEAGEVFVLRNIKQGPQPDALFEIPKDYKRKNFVDPKAQSEFNSIMDLMEGKNDAFEQAKQKQQEQNKKLDDINKDPNKSEQQKILESLKMLEGIDKKKK